MSEFSETLKMGKSIAKNLALGNSAVVALYQRRRGQQGYSADKDQVDYPLGVFRKHATALAPLRKSGLHGTDVLEIGPGGNVGVSLLMLLAGARSATCLDVMPWIQGTGPDALYPALVEAAAKAPETYLVAPALRERASSDPAAVARELLGHITYLCPMDIATTTLPDASQDVIFSHACFEHFGDPAGSIAQIARLLRPGGVTSHQVDLRDHRDFSHPLEFLRYSDAMWRLANSNRPSGVRNRWRASEYRAAFEQHNMEVVALHATHTTTVTAQMRQKFHPHFQTMSLEDLAIIGILLIACQC
jgi:SAM-dependent methyltransferase